MVIEAGARKWKMTIWARSASVMDLPDRVKRATKPVFVDFCGAGGRPSALQYIDIVGGENDDHPKSGPCSSKHLPTLSTWNTFPETQANPTARSMTKHGRSANDGGCTRSRN